MANYFKCNNCGKIFLEEDAPSVRTSYEDYYGVGHLFSYSTPLTYYVCPHCGDESLEDFEACECECCGKLVQEDDAVLFKKENFCIECAIDILSKYALEILEKFCVFEYSKYGDDVIDTFNANKHLSVRECLEALVKCDEAIIFYYADFIERGGY